ncbi:MAG: hypothetical protein DRP63_08045, partial [Planctomycetota bacterium]
MSALKKFARICHFSAIAGCVPLALVAFAILLATGCSSRKRKSSPPSSPTITTTSLPEGEVGVAYPATTLTATGGTTPYTWSDVNNTLQTYGLTLNQSTGEITGTPNQATSSGGVTVTISVTDANNKTAQKDFTLVIYPELQITTTSLPDGYEGQTGYSVTLAATGGTGTYTWTMTSANLPANLTWDATTATISGDIATGTAGNYPLQFEVTDGIQTITANLTLTVHTQLQITTTSLPDGYEGQTGYSATLTATGGAGSYTWSMTTGRLPLYLRWGAAAATISGNIAAGASANSPFNFTVEVTDGVQTVTANFTLTVHPQLQITTTSLPDGYEGQTGYSAQLAATGGTGGTGTYAWSLTSGTLPANLTWDATTATISGDITTGTAGDYPLQFEVADGIQTVTATLTLTVYEPLQITTTSLPDASEGAAYSFMVQAAGGNTSNYAWSISGQPSWLSIDAATGELSGTPPAGSAGNTYTFTVEVTDGVQTAQANLSITVVAAPPPLQITTTSLPDATEGVSYSATIEAAGGTTPYTWSVSGLPSGLSWLQVGDSVQISGTPDAGTAGTYSVDVTVTDSSSPAQSENTTLQLVVNSGGGTTWYVDGANGSDSNGGSSWSDAFATIGKALSEAADGDTILVADATYNETDLNFNGKKIYLKGVDHNTAGARPVIDCGGSGRAFYFGSGETEDSVVENFTIKNGSADNGGAIYCENSSNPTINN